MATMGYLDYNATTPLDEKVQQAMKPYIEVRERKRTEIVRYGHLSLSGKKLRRGEEGRGEE